MEQETLTEDLEQILQTPLDEIKPADTAALLHAILHPANVVAVEVARFNSSI